jgi:flagellin-specific chaperone FliS
MTSNVRAYRNSATEGATHVDILLACYDALAEDLRMAGNAAARRDFAARCRHSQRALLLVGHLESWISLLDDTELASSLTRFYEYLRSEILRLQLSSELEPFMNVALVVCETRASWQKRQSVEPSKTAESSEPPYSMEESTGLTSRFLASA